MSALIELLNKHSNLTPDQLLIKLKTSQWVKGSDMTQAIIDDWGNRSMLVGEWSEYDYEWWPEGYAHNGSFTAHSWSLEDYHRDLENCCFILMEDHEDGVPPPDHFIPAQG